MGRRYFATGSEATFGSGGTPDHWYRVLDESLRPENQNIYTDNIEHADSPEAIPGNFIVRGDFGGYAEPYYFGHVLELALGTWSASTIHAPSAVYTHSVITDDQISKRFFATKRLEPVADSAIDYRGGMIENLRLESRMGQPLMFTATSRFRNATLMAPAGDAAAEAGYDAILRPWMHENVVITYGTDTLLVQTFRLNVRKRLADGYYTSRQSDEWVFEGREITLELVTKMEDTAMLEKFFGSTGSVSPQALQTPYAITATYTTAYPLPGQGTLTGLLRLHIPGVYIDNVLPRHRGRETAVYEVSCHATYSRTYNYAIRSVIRTTHGKPL